MITFASTLFRMLEKYSKSQAYMFVRKRKPTRKKLPPPSANGAGEAPIPEEYGDDDEDDFEEERERLEFGEHKFTFEAFERVSWHILHELTTATRPGVCDAHAVILPRAVQDV